LFDDRSHTIIIRSSSRIIHAHVHVWKSFVNAIRVTVSLAGIQLGENTKAALLEYEGNVKMAKSFARPR
jgi:hypothetical protein